MPSPGEASRARAAAIVVAAGSGRRFGGPKQRAPLLGRPLYLHAVSALAGHPAVIRTVLAVPAGEESDYRREVAHAGLEAAVRVVAGGATRTDSVRQALAALGSDGDAVEAVLVHDGARPAAPATLVDALLEALRAGAAGAVPVLETSDTLRWRGRAGGPSRDEVARVGTPQAFRPDILRDAYVRAAARGETASDDAILVEAVGGRIATVEADHRIEKVTRPEDLAAAAWRLAGAADLPSRTGFGLDHHRLVAGRALWLCGVRIEGEEGLIGHSDGDVALHALANAVLGAAGDADIGRHLPPGDPATAGIASREIVALALARAAARGLGPIHAQVTLTAPRPHLGPHAEAMKASLARILGLATADVAVHATSGEGLMVDAIGAHAVATLGPSRP